MPSLVPNFEYDIFVSYRHKDNKGDHWVTEFVSALKTELEATFKEDISIYFDENPHDGLLETHDVDDSLREKLKCLIFIPIISQTYCDPKSFAWRNEFLAFVKMVDPLSPEGGKGGVGLKVKLASGNVASRILPVRIHDLDPHDKALLENEIGPLRSIDFIFRSSGVNRPLRASEEHPNDNLNKTYYRDQVNKMANAIKEITDRMLNPEKVTALKNERKSEAPKVTSPQKSIAILPFVNMSNDSEQEYFSDGITEEILNSISRVKGLKVTGRTSSFQFKGKQSDLRDVGTLLGVQYILEGSIRKQNGQIRITVQLISAEDGFHIWSERYDGRLDDIFALQDEIALEVSKKLQITLTENQLERISGTDLESYDYYLLGRYHLNQRTSNGIIKAIECFRRSVKSDSEFALSYSGLADAYLLAEWYTTIPNSINLAKETSEKALVLNPNLSEPYVSIGYFHLNNWNWSFAKQAFQKAIEINPNNARAFQWFAQYYMYRREYNTAIAFINKAREIEPLSAVIVTESGWPYLFMERYSEAIANFYQALQLDNSFALAHFNLGQCFERLMEYDKALKEYQIAVDLSNRTPFYIAFFASCLIRAGEKDKGKELLSELIELAKGGAHVSVLIALVYEAQGEKHNSILWIEKAIHSKEPMVICISDVTMPFKSILDNPRFLSALNKLPLEIRNVILGIK